MRAAHVGANCLAMRRGFALLLREVMGIVEKIKNPDTKASFLILAAVYFILMAGLLFFSLRWQFACC